MFKHGKSHFFEAEAKTDPNSFYFCLKMLRNSRKKHRSSQKSHPDRLKYFCPLIFFRKITIAECSDGPRASDLHRSKQHHGLGHHRSAWRWGERAWESWRLENFWFEELWKFVEIPLRVAGVKCFFWMCFECSFEMLRISKWKDWRSRSLPTTMDQHLIDRAHLLMHSHSTSVRATHLL